MLNPTLGQVSPAHVMSRHLAATVGAILAIVLCGWLLYTYMPKELYLHFWRAVYPARRVAFWACLIAASLVTTVWVIRLCVLGLRIR